MKMKREQTIFLSLLKYGTLWQCRMYYIRSKMWEERTCMWCWKPWKVGRKRLIWWVTIEETKHYAKLQLGHCAKLPLFTNNSTWTFFRILELGRAFLYLNTIKLCWIDKRLEIIHKGHVYFFNTMTGGIFHVKGL
jgi:hypothetical protein